MQKMHLKKELNVSQKWFSKNDHKPRMVNFKRKIQKISEMWEDSRSQPTPTLEPS